MPLRATAAAIIAAQISPPPYVRSELGERPRDPQKRNAWDRGLAEVEAYRQEHGVKDSNRAFGPKAKHGVERTSQEQARRRLLDARRALGLERARDMGHSLEIGW